MQLKDAFYLLTVVIAIYSSFDIFNSSIDNNYSISIKEQV